MIVYIVMVDGKIDAVFFDKDLAKKHRNNWNKILSSIDEIAIVKKQVYDF